MPCTVPRHVAPAPPPGACNPALPRCATLLTGRSGRRSDAGFGLIELLVAMALLGVVMAAILSVLTSAWSGSSRTTADRKSFSVVNDAVEQMGIDIRALRSHHRSPRLIRDVRSLTDFVQRGENVPNPERPGTNLDLWEVKVATATEFTFLADVSPTMGAEPELAECITYRITQGGGTFQLDRIIRPYSATCAGGGETTNIIPRQPVDGTPGARFEYELVCRPALCGGYPLKGAGGGRCPARLATGVGGNARNWVSGIQLEVTGITEHGGVRVQDRGLQNFVGIRTRHNADYRHALGCVT